VLHSYVCNIQREIRFIREVDDSFFVVCIKCDISGNPILPSRAILIGDIWRERKNRSCISCFICPPSVWGYSLPARVHKHYKGRRVGPLMDLLFASRRGEYQRILSSRLAIASRFENQSPLLRDSCVSARIFAILQNRFIAWPIHRFRPDGAMADVVKTDARRRYSAAYECGEWIEEIRLALQAFKENLGITNLMEH